MEQIRQYWFDFFKNGNNQSNWWTRKQALWKERDGKIVNVQVRGRKYQTYNYDSYKSAAYFLYFKFLIKQNGQYHLEEQIIPKVVLFQKGEIIKHRTEKTKRTRTLIDVKDIQMEHRKDGYDRREAVRYADRWWNDYNSEFQTFTNDCTNYISQCLFYGGAPMQGAPNREQGWWYENYNWSFSWSVAHSLRWYLSGSTEGLKGEEVTNPEELLPGDVICYDFNGDDRWDHTTIVVRHDAYGMPLVNAHTDNSKNRYWSYEDSSAWTPNIQYKFFRIST